jgi:CheY-like chemotaxis protein
VRILVVEDDKHIRRILESLLTKEPSLAARAPEIVAAADGEAGVKALEKGPYDLVITDLLMPHMDGFQFCRELRKHPHGQKVPVIVTSAIFKDNAAQIRIKQEVGEHHFFAKPYEIKDLVKTVNRILDGAKPPPKKDPTPAAGVPLVREPPESGLSSDRAPPRVLLDLAERRASGTLVFTRGKVQKEIGLTSGVIVSCDSNLRSETLGHFLVSRGVIDEQQHQVALTRTHAQKERLGQALIELGWISEKDLLAQLGAQARAKVASLLRWRDGAWSFQSGEPPANRVQTPVDTVKLVFLGLQKTAQLDEIAQLLAQVRGSVGLTASGERHRDTFVRVFGPLGVDALARRPRIEDLMSGTDPAQMLTHLDALLVCGLAEVEPAGVPQRAHAEAADPLALERITQPAPPAPAPQKNLYDELFNEEPSQVRALPDATVRQNAAGETDALRKEILAEYLSLTARNHYELLGVAPDAPPDAVAAAHARKLERFRLERFADADLGADYAHVEELHEAFARAHEVLMTPELRADYNRALAAQAEPSRASIDAELYANQASSLLAAGDALAARLKLEDAVAASPDEPSYRALLAWATFAAAGGADPLRAREAAAAARPITEQALALDPENLDALDVSGRIAAAAGDAERAAAHLERVLDVQPQRTEALSVLEAVYLARSAWKPLERRYRKLIHRLGDGRDPLRISLWTKLAELYTNQLGDAESAKVARDVLAKLGAPHPHASANANANVNADEQFQQHLAAERWDAAFVAAACAPSNPEAAAFHRRYRPRFLQRAAGPIDWTALRHPDDEADLGHLLELVLAALDPPVSLGATDPMDLLPTHFARVLDYCAAQLGLAVPPVHRLANLRADVSAAGQPALILAGPQALALADHPALAFRIGRALSLCHAGRALALAVTPRQLKECLLAGLSLVSSRLRVEDPEGTIAQLRARLAASPELAPQLAPLAERLLSSPQGALNLTRFLRGVQRTADRVGLALCNDPGVALPLVAAIPGAAEELTAWALSDPYLALRDRLGVSVAL